MDTPENGPSTPTELQCLPEKNVGRRSVEITKVVEEFYGPPGEQRGWWNEAHIPTRHSPECTKPTKYGSNDSDGWEYSVEPFTDDSNFPDNTVEIKRRLSHKETGPTTSAAGSRGSALQISTVGDKGSRASLYQRRAEGYEAAFLRHKARGAGQTPTRETMEDILYRKTNRILHYPTVDMKEPQSVRCSSGPSQPMGMPPAVCNNLASPPVAYSKRMEPTVTQTKLVRGKQDSQLSLPAKVNRGQVDPAIGHQGSGLSTQVTRKTSDMIRRETKRSYYSDLSQQVQERRQLIEREKRRNADVERVHAETMLFGTWGKPGSGAPNPPSARRTKFSSAGILSQDQVPRQGFAGIPFHLRV
ncbi:uncharacterized protein LOC134455705 isoform X2 [Engraulis encrasicolus]|uniref:uncharacterized protein LOC134455705 isoform X2 n=1 Tax=Engraulis encrasicolus TaxID=184585 RepID=UPI002FD53F69